MKNTPNLEDAPDTPAYYKFWAEHWSDRYARNAMLHFIKRNKLDRKLMRWLKKHYPENES